MTISEVAKALNVSEKTIRRRVKDGTLPARLVGEPPRYEISPDDISAIKSISDQEGEPGQDDTKDVMWELAEALQNQLREKDRQIRELHVLLQTSQEQLSRAMLPPPMPRRPWWRFWN